MPSRLYVPARVSASVSVSARLYVTLFFHFTLRLPSPPCLPSYTTPLSYPTAPLFYRLIMATRAGASTPQVSACLELMSKLEHFPWSVNGNGNCWIFCALLAVGKHISYIHVPYLPTSCTSYCLHSCMLCGARAARARRSKGHASEKSATGGAGCGWANERDFGGNRDGFSTRDLLPAGIRQMKPHHTTLPTHYQLSPAPSLHYPPSSFQLSHSKHSPLCCIPLHCRPLHTPTPSSIPAKTKDSLVFVCVQAMHALVEFVVTNSIDTDSIVDYVQTAASSHIPRRDNMWYTEP